jgi:hypothetical protein
MFDEDGYEKPAGKGSGGGAKKGKTRKPSLRQTVSMRMAELRERYLEEQERRGGNSVGWQEYWITEFRKNPERYDVLALAKMAGAKAWEAKPKEDGPTLFSIAGVKIPEHITRPAQGFLFDTGMDDESAFEKVSHKFATIADGRADAHVKTRKAGQAAAAAERKQAAMDEAERRAGGDVSKLLKDVADKKPKR